MAARRKDYTGQRFGRLVVLAFHSATPNNITRWTCQCDCGKQKDIRIDVLRNGTSQSCGCLARELSSARNSVHGASYNRTPEYVIWCGMRNRCNCITNKDYPNYGGRGIIICPEWNSYAAFLFDVGPRPSNEHSLDRIDVNGNYEPKNCRWATHSEQMLNRRPFTWTEHRDRPYDEESRDILSSI